MHFGFEVVFRLYLDRGKKEMEKKKLKDLTIQELGLLKIHYFLFFFIHQILDLNTTNKKRENKEKGQKYMI